MRDGGLIDGWTVGNISMTLKNGGQPIYMTSYPRHLLPERGQPPGEPHPPGSVRNIAVSNVVAYGDGAIFLSGMVEKPLQNICFDNVQITMMGGKVKDLHAAPPYPFRVWGHRVAPYDIFCRNVDGLRMRNVRLSWNTPEKPEWGSAIRCQNVRDLEIDGFVGRQALGSDAPAIWLKNTKRVFIRNSRAPEQSGTFVKLDEGTENVTVMNNDLGQAKQVALVGSKVDPKQLFEAGNRLPELGKNRPPQRP
jgi:hypothetical protein